MFLNFLAIFVKKVIMGIYTIKINEKTKAGKNLVAFLKSLKDVVSIKKVERSAAIDEALEDINQGRTFSANDSKDLLNQCLS
ncbi:hypothetical protein SAMN05444285_10630 [Draconibacterium orientale]|uniref:Uncharacterized protein n=2 Tax=Draconibacterium orientale TaxID=1168034 RepID=A0A1I0BU63_9BACT|nr:hypothetical protein SAMN05444285_10630 [Draconibacterium orientale]